MRPDRPTATSLSRRQLMWRTTVTAASAWAWPKDASAETERESPLYRSAAGRAAVMEIYERQLRSLTIAHQSQTVATRFGPTHVLTLGAPSRPPLVALHGVHFNAPFMAEIVRPFAESFRIFIPDVVGQPGRSAPVQPAPTGHNYAAWLMDVLDGLKLDTVPVIGTSFGGAIALDLAATAPRRISKAALVVPGGFNTSAAVLVPLVFRLLLPWHAYRLFPDRARLKTTLDPLAWEMSDGFYDYFDAILRHVHWLIRAPGPFSREDLTAFHAPTAVYAARHDIFFPGDELLVEARAALPNLADSTVFDSSHYPTRAMQAEVNRRIAAFLA